MRGLFLECKMAAIKKSVRLIDETQAILHNLTLTGEINWSGSINDMATQFEMLIHNNTPMLTDNEWNVFYCAYNGYMPSKDCLLEAESLHLHVSDGYKFDDQIRQFIGSEEAALELTNRVELWSLSEKIAVTYKAKSFWRKGRAD